MANGIVRPFTDVYLLDYSKEHVAYEIDMLFGVGGYIAKGAQLQSTNQADLGRLNNLIVEGFGIHLRNLLDFLYIDRPQPSDIVASDYCPANAWAAARAPISGSLSAARTRANKELAHLTTERQSGTPVSKRWAAQQLLAEIAPILKSFAALARPAALSPDVIQQINKL